MIKKEIKFTFHSAGTYHVFAPFKMVYDGFIEKKKRTQLDMYRDMVTFRNDPTCFIVDNTGHVLN